MGDMQGISLVELVREGAGMVVSSIHKGEEKLIFLPLKCIYTPS